MKKSKWLRPKCSGSIIFKLKIPMKIGNELDGLRVVKVFLQGCSKSWRTLWIWAIQGNEAVLAQPLLAFCNGRYRSGANARNKPVSFQREQHIARLRNQIFNPVSCQRDQHIEASRSNLQIFKPVSCQGDPHIFKSSNLSPAREINPFSNFQINPFSNFQISPFSNHEIIRQSLY
ncbi:MAG: hypothetical protein IPM91_22295 [Bacteroidetes bacterium]|nr:hypothetical protein [Bacteroidota bacterium]